MMTREQYYQALESNFGTRNSRIIGFKNKKTSLGLKYGWVTGTIAFTPGVLCPSEQSCHKVCIGRYGSSSYPKAILGRKKKTDLFLRDPALFISMFEYELHVITKKLWNSKYRLAMRINAFSDVEWFLYEQMMDIIRDNPDVQFYDYTARAITITKHLLGELPKNYDVTFSRKANNWPICKWVLESGGKVAAVFRGTRPKKYQGFPVVDGNKHDLTFKHPAGSIIGLKAKGLARFDKTGFVIDV